jgi:hypothetical protein
MSSERASKQLVISTDRKTWSRKTKKKITWCMRTERANTLNLCRWWWLDVRKRNGLTSSILPDNDIGGDALCLGLPSGFFPSGLSTKTLYTLTISSTSPLSHPPYFIALTKSDKNAYSPLVNNQIKQWHCAYLLFPRCRVFCWDERYAHSQY